MSPGRTDPPRADVALVFARIRSQLASATSVQPSEQMAALRKAYDSLADLLPRKPDLRVRSTPVDVDGLVGEWVCTPDCDPERRILHLHGGGLFAGSLTSHRPMVSGLAAASGWAVLHIDYRLAPEHSFPAANDDAFKAFAWLRRNGPQGPGSAHKACLSGDSAGGDLAVSTVARMIDAGEVAPNGLALIGPCLDYRVSSARPELASDPLVSATALAAVMLYIGQAVGRDDPRVSSLLLEDSVLSQFPPTLIQVSAAEYLMPEAQAMAARIASLGQRVALSAWPDMPHVWHMFLNHIPEGQAALTEIAAFFAAT